MLLIIWDMNAKVGANNTNYDRAMGKHGCGVMNNNGERLVDFCLDNNRVVGKVQMSECGAGDQTPPAAVACACTPNGPALHP